MKVIYEFIRDGIEGDVKVVQDEAAGVVKVIVEPYFYNPKAIVPTVTVTTTTDRGRIITEELHAASGQSGKLMKFGSGKQVKPLCDTEKKVADES